MNLLISVSHNYHFISIVKMYTSLIKAICAIDSENKFAVMNSLNNFDL